MVNKRIPTHLIAGAENPLGAPSDQDVVTYDAASDRAVWAAPGGGSGIPAGGSDGQVLTKQSGTDYDADWETLPSGLTRPLSWPQGTKITRYGFTSGTESWTASAGTLGHDATNGWLTHTVAATATTYILLEPSGATAVSDGEYVYDLENRTLSASPIDTGMVFRATDASNHYLCQIRLLGASNQTAIFFKRVAGTYTSLATIGLAGSIPSFPGSNRIRARIMVRCIGAWMGVWINELFVGATQDTTYTTGRGGIFNIARNSSSEVTSFDDFTSYSLSSTFEYPPYD